MQDLSRTTGNRVVVSYGEHDYILKGFTLKDVGLVQSEYLRLKRDSMLQSVASLRTVLPQDDYLAEMKAARIAASEMQNVSKEEIQGFITSPNGFQFATWVLFESQYPGKFTRNSILEMFASGELDQEKITQLFSEILDEPVKN